MTCGERVEELVECARRDTGLNRELRAHLSVCAPCSERWDRERQLSAHLRGIQARTAGLRSHDFRRELLLRDFARMHRRPAVASWVWAFGAAAALLLAVFVGHEAGKLSANRAGAPGVPGHFQTDGFQSNQRTRSGQTVLYEASGDASALSTDDFIAIPYTPPLAPGEMIRVVHADLYPEALASMGVEVDPSWAGDLPADVVVGEDGLPRAVRIAENGQF